MGIDRFLWIIVNCGLILLFNYFRRDWMYEKDSSVRFFQNWGNLFMILFHLAQILYIVFNKDALGQGFFLFIYIVNQLYLIILSFLRRKK